jgi:hypothetical protein
MVMKRITSSLMPVWRSSSATARRRVDVEHHVMRLAVLGDAIGEAAQAPGLGLDDLPPLSVMMLVAFSASASTWA